MLQTEENRDELWIFNIKYKQYFNKKLAKTHKNRGLLLGYPCPGYFEDTIVYSYLCPVNIENEMIAVKKWHIFNKYAILMGWNLQLNLQINYL